MKMHSREMADTRAGMPIPPNAGPSYLKFKVGRNLQRQLARMMLKEQRGRDKMQARRQRKAA